jgi:hypothetical protein
LALMLPSLDLSPIKRVIFPRPYQINSVGAEKTISRTKH